MSNKDKEKDLFLQSIGNVKPLKKSNKELKEIKEVKAYKTIKKKILIEGTDKPLPATKIESVKKNLNIEKPSILKKLKRGKIQIDKKIDFHGLSTDKAKKIFIKTINSCFYSNKRCILFITGKGMKKNNHYSAEIKLFYGKIRENFQQWVFEKEVSQKILKVAPADFSYGGDGAFFVYLRKNKR
tara:strand:- start:535 stop:1086 length:552 start_codon:yes stop_codon:yes gene_type:complete